MTGRLLEILAGTGVRRARLTIALAVLAGVLATALALGLAPTAATSSFVSSSSSEYRATQRFYASFGEEPVEVLVQGSVRRLVLSGDLERLVGLEGCLSGNVPVSALASEGGVHGPCGQLASLHSVKVVLGPGTFIAEAAQQIDAVLAQESAATEREAKLAERDVYRAARSRGYSRAHALALARGASKVTIGRFEEHVVTQALEHGLTSPPSLDNTNFVSRLVFQSSESSIPKQRFAYLFPSAQTALVSVRMRPGLSQATRNRTIALIRAAVGMGQWRMTHGERYLVTGEPVIVSDLTHSISSSLKLLLVLVLLVMAGALGLLFAGRPRMLPLAIALLAAALTFGGLSLVGASLTVASIAVLPVLIGLAVDYAIQFQSRVGEHRADGPGAAAWASGGAGPGGAGGPDGPDTADGGPGERGLDARGRAIVSAVRSGGPAILTAAAASAAAVLVLTLSPVPMVAGFGVLLVAGVAIALLCAFLVGAAALARYGRPVREMRVGSAASSGRRRASRSWRALGALAASWRGAGELLRDNPLTRALTHAALVRSPAHPRRVLCAGLALAALGWGLDTQTKVETDITKLVPQNLASLQALGTLERSTGVGGEIALLVSARDVASAASIEWMSSYQSAVLERFGYSAANGCGRARLCPAFSLPDLFHGASGPVASSATKLNQAQVDGLLAAVPPYFSQDVISADRRTATLAFGIRLMSLQRQQQLVEAMRSMLHPPAGVSAQLVGLPVLAAQSGAAVADPWRRVETLLAALAAVALVLLLAFRGQARRALVPLVPIVLATGWSALILFALRVPLNPMSVTLGALVIAVSTEFSVLLCERHREERLAGHDTLSALRRGYRRTGAAVAASGTTAIAGFGVLAFSDIRMLRDFGIVTLVDLGVSLVGVLLALPAALVLADGAGEPVGARVATGRWRGRRARRRLPA